MRILHGGLALALLSCVSLTSAMAATVTVRPGPAAIQAAVNAANPGDTILVQAGTYSEQVIIKANSNGVPLNGLTVIGQKGAILSGPGQQATTGLDLEGKNITIQGLTIRNFSTGFQDLGDSNRVTDTVLTNNLGNGAYCFSSNLDFERNTITGNGTGVDATVFGGYIENCLISGNRGTGLICDDTSFYDGATLPAPFPTSLVLHVDHNLLINNGGSGLYFNSAEAVSATHNLIGSNAGSGIDMDFGSFYCDLSHNQIIGNVYDGILVRAQVYDNTFTHNETDHNGHDGIEVWSNATGNEFSHDSADRNMHLDAEDFNAAGMNTWSHDDFETSNPVTLGK